MIYGILKRYEGGPKDLVRLEKSGYTQSYYIDNVLIRKDPEMHYKHDKNLGVWSYSVGKDFIYLKTERLIRLNKYDTIFEVEDDDSARLYYEVLDQ